MVLWAQMDIGIASVPENANTSETVTVLQPRDSHGKFKCIAIHGRSWRWGEDHCCTTIVGVVGCGRAWTGRRTPPLLESFPDVGARVIGSGARCPVCDRAVGVALLSHQMVSDKPDVMK